MTLLYLIPIATLGARFVRQDLALSVLGVVNSLKPDFHPAWGVHACTKCCTKCGVLCHAFRFTCGVLHHHDQINAAGQIEGAESMKAPEIYLWLVINLQ